MWMDGYICILTDKPLSTSGRQIFYMSMRQTTYVSNEDENVNRLLKDQPHCQYKFLIKFLSLDLR